MRKIKDLTELKELSSKKKCKCFIVLNFGVRSVKDIRYYPSKDIFKVFNEIDGTEQQLTENQLSTETNIIRALENGALWR